DRRVDLYALGCVGYWLLTGRPVFAGDSLYELISNHLHVMPDPPSRHTAHAVPAELDVLILGCLEKLPEQRPANAQELRRRLCDVSLAGSWSDEQAAAWWAGHPHGTNLASAQIDALRGGNAAYSSEQRNTSSTVW